MSLNCASSTKLLYLEDTYIDEGKAIILSLQEIPDKGISLILDQTIFYPQGGGQPADTGEISTINGARFLVNDVRTIDGLVHHFGTLIAGSIEKGEEAKIKIDPLRRRLNARLHSAGHLIDAAVQCLSLPLKPSKGYHFPDGPYVEYEGEIEAEKREDLRQQLEQKVTELVSAQLITQIVSTDKANLLDHCPYIPDYINDDKPVRVITMLPKLGCPCGGTHVKKSDEIGQIRLTKLKAKGGQIKISYALQNA